MTVCDARFYDVAMTEEGAPSMLPFAESPWREMYEEAARLIGPSEPVIDLGCGTGRFAQALYAVTRSSTYLGLDFSQAALAEARRSTPEESADLIEYGECDLTIWEPSNEIDGNAIFACLEVLEHLEDDRDLVRRIPPGRRLIFSVPNYPSAAHVRDFRTLREIWEHYGTLVVFNRWARVELGSGHTIHLLDTTRRTESW
jgi:trans-aconitate methyltransferase